MQQVNPPLPLVGRDAALAELRHALAQAENRRGQLVLVSGEPGIGKSALADLIGQEAIARGGTVVFGRAWELAEAPPYFPIWSCLRSLGIEPPVGVVAESDAFHLWERVLEALGRAAAARPVVWILEDLHAADLQTLDLLTYLARPLRALGVLLLLTLRDLDPRIGDRTAARLARLGRDGRELHLGQLELAEVQALAQAVAGRTLPGATVRQLSEVTGGNPLFVIECARGYRDGARVHLPASVRTLIAERVALLVESAREVLACGAIVGREFTAAMVARMMAGLPAQVIDRLAPALRAGIVLELRPGQFRFSHILVRDAIEETLGPAACADLHGRAAHALADAGDAVDVLVERARHALGALSPEGDPVGLASKAARALTALGAFDRALALYQRIEDAHAAGLAEARPDADEALRRAAVARAAGRHADARRRCQEVLTEARARGDGKLMGRAALELGAELRPGAVDAGLVGALRESLALDPDDPVLRCRLEARLAAALQPADDPSGPSEMARAAIARARTLDDPALMLEVLHTAGSALVDYAPLEERLALGSELRDRARACGDLPRELLAHARLAHDHLEEGDFVAFEADLVRLRALTTAAGHPRWRWRPLLLESMRAIAHGDFEGSERCLVEVRELASLTDAPALSMALPVHTFSRAMLFHRDDEVRMVLSQLPEVMQDVPSADLLMAGLRLGALARMEDVDGARRALDSLRGRAFPLLDLGYLAGEAYALVGPRDQQIALRDEFRKRRLRHLVSGHVPVTYEGPILRTVALLEASLGDHPAAIAGFTEALAGASRRGHALWVAQLSYDLGRALAGAGRTAEAAPHLEAAAALAEALEMTGLGARARARLNTSTGALAPAPPTPAGATSLTREGVVWRLDVDGRSVRVRHSRGMELLARLVERAGEELHVLALASDAGATLVEGDAGDLLDAQARREYQVRLAEIDGELEQAERDHDLGRKTRLGRERDALETELGRAVGLGGRSRAAASATERARVNAQRRLKDAIARISEVDAALGARLGAAVHTGTYCCFRP
jgi:tetratricopeptide (TPR) repeat protein